MICALPRIRWVEDPDGGRVPFDPGRLCASIRRVCTAGGAECGTLADSVTRAVESFLRTLPADATVNTCDLSRWVEHALRTLGFDDVADRYAGKGEPQALPEIPLETAGSRTPVSRARLETYLREEAGLDEGAARAVARGVCAAVARLSYGRVSAELLADVVAAECASRGGRIRPDPEAMAEWLLGRKESAGAPEEPAADGPSEIRIAAGDAADGVLAQVELETVARRVDEGFELAFFLELGRVLDRLAAAVSHVAAERTHRPPECGIRVRLVGVEECARRFRGARRRKQCRAFVSEVRRFAREWIERRLPGANCRLEAASDSAP